LNETKKRKLARDETPKDPSRTELEDTIDAQANMIKQLKLEIDGLKLYKKEITKYESEVIFDKSISGFRKYVLEKQKVQEVKLPTQDERLPGQRERDIKLLKKQYEELESHQKSFFSYVNIRHNHMVKLHPNDQIQLGEVSLLCTLLKLSSAFNRYLYEDNQLDCIGDSTVNVQQNIWVAHQHGEYKGTCIRMICGLLYGFDAMRGKECSHICGSRIYLNPDHLIPEARAKNDSRDYCHLNGLYGSRGRIIRVGDDEEEEICDHEPRYLKSHKCDLHAIDQTHSIVPAVVRFRIEIKGPAPIAKPKLEENTIIAPFSYIVSKVTFPNDVHTPVSSLEKASHYLIGTAKFGKTNRKRCTANTKGSQSKCTAKIFEVDDVRMLAAFMPHTCVHGQ